MSPALPLLLTSILALPACSTRSAPDSSKAPGASGEQAQSPDTAEAPATSGQEQSPGTAEAPATGDKKPLSHYLAAATTAKVYDTTNLRAARLVDTLSQDETRAFLARFDLSQRPDGPLVRCPPTKLYAFEDGAGTALGSISFCGDRVRFDSPDGTAGGIDGPGPGTEPPASAP